MKNDQKKSKIHKSGLEFTSNGDGTCYVSGIGTCKDMTITIPSVHEGEKVIGIGELVFYKRENITSITIPSGVTFIGELAFYNCKNLEVIQLPESIASVGKGAFSYCEGLQDIRFTGTEEQWETISKGENWDHGVSATVIFNFKEPIAKGSKNIPFFRRGSANENGQESKKPKTSKIIIAFSLIALLLLSGFAVYLTAVKPDSEQGGSAEKSPQHAHDYISNVTAPTCTENGYTTYTCACGESYIDDAVEAIGHIDEWQIVAEATKTEDGFKVQKCSACGVKLAEEIVPATGSIGLKFTSKGDGTCYVSGIGTCTDTDIVIPSAYNGMRVTSIGSSAFAYCDGLTSVTIPDSVTSIGSYAFNDCDGLTSITIPDSVTSIGSYAFCYCTKLTSITVDSDHPNYASIDGVLFNKAITKFICYPAGKTGAYTIPDSVTIIGSYAFYGCSGLTSVTIPDSVTSIGFSAFYYCYGLTSITIPDGVTSIGGSAFENCSGLTSITLPFVGNKLNGTSNTDFGYIFGASSYSDNFSSVPTSLKTVVITGGSSIGDRAFYGCSGLTSVTIPDSVTSIGDYAFDACSGLTSITIPDGVTSIGNYAFLVCSGLTSITIPDSVTSIVDGAFSSCDSLTSITFNGTKAQWNAIYKGSNWKYKVPATEVVCSDGTVALT